MRSDDAKMRRMVFVVTFVLGAATACFTFVRTDEGVQAAQLSLDLAQQQYDRDRSIVAQIPRFSSTRSKLQDELRDLTTGKTAGAVFINYLDTLARRRHLSIESIAFTAQRGDVPTTVSPSLATTVSPAPTTPLLSPQPAMSPAPSAERLFYEQPCSLVLVGSYRSLLFALADLSRGPVLVRIDDRPTLESVPGGIQMTLAASLLETDVPILGSDTSSLEQETKELP